MSPTQHRVIPVSGPIERPPQLIVAVLATHAWPYPMLASSIRRTWAADRNTSVSVLFYRGGGREDAVRGDNLILRARDDLASTGAKTLACFRFLLAHRDFDLIYRTNCSSYVDIPNLRSFAEQSANSRSYYAGVVGRHRAIPFASGSGYFISRDLVHLAVTEAAAWDHDVADDVALGQLLYSHGIEPVPLPRKDYTSASDVRNEDVSLFHFRCKTATPWRVGDIRIFIRLRRTFRRHRGQSWRPLVAAEATSYVFESALRVASAIRRRRAGMRVRR